MIDGALGLDDRLITAAAIDSSGGPRQPMEHALIEDAAGRIADAQPSSIVPYRRPRHVSYALIGLVALTVAVAIPQKALPQSEEAVIARADIQSAGELLAQSAEQIGEAIEPGTTTAQLAKEQADLGRMLKASGEDRTDALKKLSALGDRIQQRHRELEATRADEIVSLADQKLRAALEPGSNNQRAGKKPTTESDAGEGLKDAPEMAGTKKDSGEQQGTKQASAEAAGKTPTPQETAGRQKESDVASKTSADRRNGNVAGENPAAARTGTEAQNKPQQPVPGEAGQPSTPQQSTPQAGGAQGQPAQQQTPEQAGGQGEQNKQSDSQSESGDLAGALAGQAAKALPSLSEQLLQKAGELRANQLDPATIAALSNAAASLAKDLSSIAQSKDFQQALEQMARQINPEQLEQVARELMKNEQLMRELQAAAKLLSENQQAKDMVAGLARSLGGDARRAGEEAARRAGQQAGGEGQHPARVKATGSQSGRGKRSGAIRPGSGARLGDFARRKPVGSNGRSRTRRKG